MQNPFEIRKITKDDDAQLAAIIRSVLEGFGATGPGYAHADPELDTLCEAYSSPRSAYFVVETCGRVLGGAGIAPLRGGDALVCELQKMYMLPEIRGRGAGQALWDACLRAAREFGFTGCYLETIPAMIQAQKLYQRNGFRQIDSPMGNTGHTKCGVRYYREI